MKIVTSWKYADLRTLFTIWEINLLLHWLWHVIVELLLLLLLTIIYSEPKQKHLAQKHVTEESLVVINFEQICLEVSFTKRQ